MTATAVANAVGVLGAALIVVAYFLLQSGRIDSRALTYSVVNGLGAAGILYSLFFEFNLSALVIEAFWLAISLYGIFRAITPRRAPLHDVPGSADARKAEPDVAADERNRHRPP